MAVGRPPKARIPREPGDDYKGSTWEGKEQPKEQPPQQQQQYDKPLPELERIGALWKRKSKKGTVYLSGVCHDEKIMVFAVSEEYRKNSKSPHYKIMRSKVSDDDIPF